MDNRAKARSTAAKWSDGSAALFEWTRKNPIETFLILAVTVTLVYFYGFWRFYGNEVLPVWPWAWMRFKPQYNQEHSKLVPALILFLLWHHRKAIRTTPIKGSNWGLAFIGFGILCFIIAARALQARVALFAFPFLAFGIIFYIWGWNLARLLLFPCVLFFFMIPLGAIEQTSFRLQFMITGIVEKLSALIGIRIYSVGTTLRAADNSWGFDIAEGCSGIRSLIAMFMLTTMYVHLFEKTLWKKALIVAFSVIFAVIGNAARIFTIIVIARLGFPAFAGGLYHEYSGFIFFPVAVAAMLSMSKLLNIKYEKAGRALLTPEKVSYDY